MPSASSSTETQAQRPVPCFTGLRCPRCASALEQRAEAVTCLGSGCGLVFPVVRGVPVLVDEAKSIFSWSDYTGSFITPMGEAGGKLSLLQRVRRLAPEIGVNVRGQANYERFSAMVRERGERPRVLVVGGRVLGRGMEDLAHDPKVELVETDVGFGPRTQMICDGHDLPFEDASFDGVVVQAVLEHVCDPYRCVAEIYRVLRPGGAIYAETPFMQQVHGGAYDFTRFTDLGHRRLFRCFEAEDWGPCGGPGMALAWAWQYFLLSFATGKLPRSLLRLAAELTGFWLKYFDYWLIRTPGTRDAASGYFFLGHKSDRVLSDRELIALYRGAQ